MPLVSASNENQAKYCALMFLGVSLKIEAVGLLFSKLNTSKKVTYYKYALG